jgi:hypothetical protein
MQAVADLRLDRPFTCTKCSATFDVRELKTSSGASLFDHAAKFAKQAFDR